ncbi:hypothetical protein F5X96DRAFT_628975 [Biscogniauxia mediterranea]|nr:hypothetical protein F5X96DRAFT_628975 [Biscogniauxia mediterranea]
MGNGAADGSNNTTESSGSNNSSSAAMPTSSAGQEPASRGGDERDESTTPTIWQGLQHFYQRNIGLVFVFTAQCFGSIMNTAAKLLTSPDSPNKFHALQIISVRMFFTAVLGSLYMWYKKVPDFPLGQPSIRGLLVLRGTAGFFGLFGLYYSLSYLEISDATAITFLVPTWTAIVCFVWLKEPYGVQESLAGLIAFTGVLLIARPAFLFGHHTEGPILNDPIGTNETLTTFMTEHDHQLALADSPSPFERAVAISFAIIGTFGAAVAYGTIRVIGKRAHSLVSVNYFAVLATIGSSVIILVHPDLQFVLPQGVMQWTLLTIIGVAGFLLQFLLTEGLQREKAGRATNMIYIQMVFALIIERVIWGTTPPVMSFAGSGLIIGAAIWLSFQKSKPSSQKDTPVIDEESALLGNSERDP